jgi:hypothetical protein
VQRKHGRYFEALSVHPRMLVGREVPSMTKEGTETLENTQDAREWQEAVQLVLQQEIENTAGSWIQDSVGFMETVHSSIDLFRNNPDLIPGTKGFNKELADSFASMASAYEVRIDGKLHGYSVPVQPIIESLRKQLGNRPPAAGKHAQRQAQEEPPQRGVRSKAPSSSEPEDFSTLFGTIGLPHLKI